MAAYTNVWSNISLYKGDSAFLKWTCTNPTPGLVLLLCCYNFLCDLLLLLFKNVPIGPLLTDYYCLSFLAHSLALNRFKEFLNSNLLYGMYSDALAGGNLDFATSEQPQSFVKLQSFLQAPVHISRVDAFTHVQLALGKAVCRFVLWILFPSVGLREEWERISERR